MATAVIMPKAGMAMETGTIIKWHKAVGDPVEAGEVLLEIETDKVAMEVEAEVGGQLLATLFGPGDVVPVTQTIGYIGQAGDAVPDPLSARGGLPESARLGGGGRSESERPPSGGASAGSLSQSVRPPAGTVSPSDRRAASQLSGSVPATPAAKRRMRELGVDPRTLTASAADGALRLRDVEAFVGAAPPTAKGAQAVEQPGDRASQGGKRVSPLAAAEAARAGVSLEAVQGSGPGGRIVRADLAEQAVPAEVVTRWADAAVQADAVRSTSTPAWEGDGDSRTTLSGIRKVIAARMSESHRIIPPTTLHAEADVTTLLGLRAEINKVRDTAPESIRTENRVSINDLVLAATARAVRACPWMRVSLDGADVIQHAEVNLGMAVAIESGLVVPVIHRADTLTLTELSRRARELGSRARARKLEISEMQGGTFSVSNLGMYGVTGFTPIVNPPEAAILGVGAVVEHLAIGADGGVETRSRMHLSLTLDHRLIDGAQGALFLRALIDLLEKPLAILL